MNTVYALEDGPLSNILKVNQNPRLSQSPLFVLVVRRRTDFYHLQRAIFYRPDFRSAVCRGVAALMSNQRALSCVTSFSGKLDLSLARALTR